MIEKNIWMENMQRFHELLKHEEVSLFMIYVCLYTYDVLSYSFMVLIIDEVN